MRTRLIGIISFLAWNCILNTSYFKVEVKLIERDSALLDLVAFDHLLFLPFMMTLAIAPVCSVIISEYTIRYFKKNDNPRLYLTLMLIYIVIIIHTFFTVRSFLQ
ncbi:hypothetical protein A6395_00880 [Exiguobacterium sp. SH31]|nr:hypothetical protein A6395_00880 [Exiguobacterium sp. SH31]